MVADRIPRIGLPSDYYGDFGIRTIPNQTNDPGFPGVLQPRTNNPLAPVVRMPTPSNEAALQSRIRVAASGGFVPQPTARSVPLAQQAPTFVAPGVGRVTGYQDDPEHGFTPGAKTDRGGKTTTTRAQAPDGLSIAALFGGGPTPGGYTAKPRPANAPAPAPVVANGYGSGYVKSNTARLAPGQLPALDAIDGVAPRRSNLFADSGYQAKVRPASVMDRGGGVASMFEPDGGVVDPWGNKLRGPAGRTAVQQPGYAYGRPVVARAPAPVVVPPATIASMYLPNGVGNPAYRDYTPTYTSDGGGQMPAAAYGGNSGGSFTDSSGGTYYTRNL